MELVLLYHFFDLQLLKKEEDCREKPIENACIQIVDCLVENVLQLEERAVGKR